MRKRTRIGMVLGLPLAGLVCLTASHLFPSEIERLHRRASSDGSVDATQWTTAIWDRVCAVGPYCDGWNDDGFCKPFDEGTWGLVYFHAGNAVAVKTFERARAGYEGPIGPASCLTPKQRPILQASSPNSLNLRPDTP